MSLRDDLPNLSPDDITSALHSRYKHRRPWYTVRVMADKEGITPQGILHRVRAGKYEAGIFLGGIMVRRKKKTKQKRQGE